MYGLGLDAELSYSTSEYDNTAAASRPLPHEA